MPTAEELYDQGLRQFCKSQANRTVLWYPEAARTFTRAIEADPQFARAYAMRARCYEALGQSDKAADDRAAAARLAPLANQPPIADRAAATAFYDRATALMEPGGLIEDALYYLFKAIDADPTLADAYYARSQVYDMLQMVDASLADVDAWARLSRR